MSNKSIIGDQAFFSALLPNIASQWDNLFQLNNIDALRTFSQQLKVATKYLQLSTSQIAVGAGNGADTVLIQGVGMNIAGANLLQSPNGLTLSSVNGTVTGAQIYSGGSFSASTGVVTGGTLLGSATFSPSQWVVSAGNLQATVVGTNMPVSAAAIQGISNGTYAGPAIGVTSVTVTNNGTQVASLTFGASSVTFVADDYQLVLNGTFPTSLSASVIDSLIGPGVTAQTVGVSLTSAQLTRVSTGQTLLNVQGLSSVTSPSVNLNNIPQTILGLVGAAAAGTTAVLTKATVDTALDETLNGSTIDVAGPSLTAVPTPPSKIHFTGDSAISAGNPSVDGQSTIQSQLPGQTAAAFTGLDASGVFFNAGSILANGPAGSYFAISLLAGTSGAAAAFHNSGLIRVDAGNRMVVDATIGGQFFNNGTLLANGGDFQLIGSVATLMNQAGTKVVYPLGTLTAAAGGAVIQAGGTIEIDAIVPAGTGAAFQSFLFADGAAGDTLQLDMPGTFGGVIQGFRAGDTIDLGGSLAVAQVVYNAAARTLTLKDGGGAVLASLIVNNLTWPSGTFAVDPITGAAGNVVIGTGANGDTILTTASAAGATVRSGTLQAVLDQTLNAATIMAAGTAGPAVVNFAGDTVIARTNPSIDQASTITSSVPGQTGAGATVLNAAGMFVNNGLVLANGPAGSTFTLNVQPYGTNAAAAPGYFINNGTIQTNAGNTMTIAIAGTSALFDAGAIVANGGSIFINAAANGIDAGYAGVSGLAVIEGGGTIETNISIPATAGYFLPAYVFADSVAGDTLKIDTLKGFTGGIRGFAAGDTIDLGAALQIATIVAGAAAGPDSLLVMKNTTGTILGSLRIAGVYNYGTFALSGGQADGFVFSTGGNGDTLLTTTAAIDRWTGGSGAWQTGSWSLSSPPGTAIPAEIGGGGTTAFTLTTGTVALTTASLSLDDPNALLRITSNTTLTQPNGVASTTPGEAVQTGGTIEVTNGASLFASDLVQFSTATALQLDPGSYLDILGQVNDSGIPASIVNGNTIGVRLSGTAIVDGGTLNAGPSQVPAGGGGSVYIGTGYSGAPASVMVENNGAVSATFTQLASDPVAYGVLTLSGLGTSWTDLIDPRDTLNSRGSIVVGTNGYAATTPAGVAQAPYAGTALLTIENSATLNDSDAVIGATADSAGSVEVNTGGVWNIGTVTGGQLNVSVGGQAVLSILNGGTVQLGGAGPIISNGTSSTVGGIGIGLVAGASGTIQVDGTNSMLISPVGMRVGRVSQNNLLTVTNGAQVQSYSPVTEGLLAGASGTVQVSDPQSLLYTNFLTVGSAGVGTLTVRNGAQAQAGGGLVLGGASNAGSGTGQGFVTIANGGSLQAAGIALWAGSTISVDSSSSIDDGYSGAVVAGAIDVENFQSLVGAGLILANLFNNGTVLAGNNSNSSLSTGGRLEITGPVSGTGHFTIASGATLQLDSPISSTQTIVFASGVPETLILNGATTLPQSIVGQTAGDRIVFGNGVTVQTGTVVATPVLGANIGLSQYFNSPSIAPGGTLQSLLLNGPGTANVTGTVAVGTLEVAGGQLQMTGGTVKTDPVAVDAQGDIFGWGTITGAVTDRGTIEANGGLLTLTGSVTGTGAIQVDPGASLRLQAAASAGAVTVNGGSLGAAGLFTVEAPGLGGLLVENQGTFTTGSSVAVGPLGLDISAVAGDSGAAVVSGARSLLSNTGTFIVGDAATGSLTIQSGATVITTPGTNGLSTGATIGNTNPAAGSSVSLSGTGSNWQIGGTLTAGNSGFGALSMAAGTTVTAQGVDEGAMPGGQGQITALGAGAVLSNTGRFVVGDAGIGQLTFSGGATGTTTAVAPIAGPVGTPAIANAVRTGGTGININNIINSSTLFAAAGTYDIPGAVTGTGVLEIDAGGVLRLDGAVGSGQTVVFATNGGTLSIGNLAAFTPAVINGFTAGDKIALPTQAYIEPSYNAATGVLQLQDNNGNTISSLTFSNKPSANTVLTSLLLPIGAVIGNQAGSDGSGVTVAGPTSSWTIGGELDVGAGGAGGLTITGGATVTASQGQIGLSGNGSGNVNLEGAGSTLSFTNDLTIGGIVPGVLTLGNGTTLSVVNNLSVGKFGVINQFGGIIDPNRFPNSGVVGPTGTTIAPLEVENAGTFFAQNGTYSITSQIIDLGTLTGAGTLQIKDGGDLVINAAADASQTVQFSTSTGTLEVGYVNGGTTNPAIGSFAPVSINGFVAGDTIQVDTLAPATFTTTGNSVAVISNGMTLGTLTFASAPGGTFVDKVQCFAAGTWIATAAGQTAVEDLRAGDTVTTVLGGPGRIVWVGARTVNCTRHPRPGQVWPVRISRHAFGPGVPARDLYVSPDHALYVDGLLVPAKSLINGTTVRQVKRRTVTYHHIELEQHDVVLADGLPAETYLDTGGRAAFEGGTVMTLHPDFSAWRWQTDGCAELVLAGPMLEAIRARLACVARPVRTRKRA